VIQSRAEVQRKADEEVEVEYLGTKPQIVASGM
jgi:hypothetical protein